MRAQPVAGKIGVPADCRRSRLGTPSRTTYRAKGCRSRRDGDVAPESENSKPVRDLPTAADLPDPADGEREPRSTKGRLDQAQTAVSARSMGHDEGQSRCFEVKGMGLAFWTLTVPARSSKLRRREQRDGRASRLVLMK